MAKAAATLDAPDTDSMFPDLDPKKASDKAVIKAARDYISIKDEREEFLDDAKEREDAAHDALIAACHEAKLTKFTIDGRQIDIEVKEKVKVKAAKVKDDENDGD